MGEPTTIFYDTETIKNARTRRISEPAQSEYRRNSLHVS